MLATVQTVSPHSPFPAPLLYLRIFDGYKCWTFMILSLISLTSLDLTQLRRCLPRNNVLLQQTALGCKRSRPSPCTRIDKGQS